jgi:DNA-binding MarR family transcriptional regulator
LKKPTLLELGKLDRVLGVQSDVRSVGHYCRIDLDALMALLLLKREGTSSPQRISSRLSFSPSKTTRHVELLLSYRLVDETLDPNDLRRSLISIVPRGLKLVSELESVSDVESLDLLFDHFAAFRHAISRYNERHPDRRLTDGKARLLTVAHLAGQPLSISELCAHARTKQSSASMMVKSLIAHGLMEDYGEQSRDGRIRKVRLAADGEEAALEILHRL